MSLLQVQDMYGSSRGYSHEINGLREIQGPECNLALLLTSAKLPPSLDLSFLNRTMDSLDGGISEVPFSSYRLWNLLNKNTTLTKKWWWGEQGQAGNLGWKCCKIGL